MAIGAVSIAILVVIALVLVVTSIFTVEQQTAAVLERFGKFLRIAGPGLHFRIPFVDGIRERVSLRVQQLGIDVESKSKDNVFVRLAIAVQYQVKEESVRDAVYRLTNHQAQ